MRLAERNAALRKHLAKSGVVGVFMQTNGSMIDLTVHSCPPKVRGKLFSRLVGSDELVCCGEKS